MLFMHHALPADERDPASPSVLPSREVTQHRYCETFATGREQLGAVRCLRLDVFNLELGEELGASFETHRGIDEFDPVCQHLMVVDRSESSVVGTFRMQTSATPASYRGCCSIWRRCAVRRAVAFSTATCPSLHVR